MLDRRHFSVCLALVVAACAAGPTTRDCTQVYTIGDAAMADAIARGQSATVAGPLPAREVPPSAPRAALEPDGSYAGGRAYCSVADARSGAATLVEKGVIAPGRPWRIYQVAANWRDDVYERRPGEFRVKRSVRMLRLVE